MVNNTTSRVSVQVDFKANLTDLKKSFNELANLTTKDLIDINKGMNTKEAERALRQIKNTVSEIEVAYNSAYNNKLGVVNLKKFNENISSSKISAQQMGAALGQAGERGKLAFTNLTTQLSKMQRITKESVPWVDKMATSLGNAIRYNLSSAVINNFTGSIRSASTYVEKLNNSLNDIRIVSGKSAEDMREFAKYANKAAQAMGTKTTDYTDASLIYYQQGLAEEEVLKRTDVTVKAANVLGSSTQEVSDYMTAIWNNFAKGSENLEYYADVLTKLGAATASSSEEIAQGLSKFSAVADTVGLSYTTATAALATVVAETRESADTVGTAFKTIFSRLQGLKLGETLEDGVDLNKYSTALEKVGVQVTDSSGEMRKLDDILSDLGEKWNNLTSAQQTALAQTVAGSRQYNTLVALMKNWGEVQENVNLALNATGTLEKQNSIYLESVEAHQKSATAAAEEFYNALIDEDTLKALADIEKAFSKIGTFLVNGFGGGLSSISLILSVILDKTKGELSNAITKLLLNTQSAKKEAQENSIAWKETKKILDEIAQNALFKGNVTTTNEEGIQKEKNLLEELNSIIIETRDNFLKISNPSDDQVDGFNNAIEKYSKAVQELQNHLSDLDDVFGKVGKKVNFDFKKTQYTSDSGETKERIESDVNFKKISKDLRKQKSDFNNQFGSSTSIAGITTSKNYTEEDVKQGLSKNLSDLRNKRSVLNKNKRLDDDVNEKMKNDLMSAQKSITKGDYSGAKKALEEINKQVNDLAKTYNNDLTNAINKSDDAIENINTSISKQTDVVNEAKGKLEDYNTNINTQFNVSKVIDAGKDLMQTFSGVSMAFNGIKSLKDIWSQEDVSTLDKIMSSYASIASIIMGLKIAYKALSIEQIKAAATEKILNIEKEKGVALTAAQKTQIYLEIVAEKISNVVKGIATAVQWALNAAMDANPIGATIVAVMALVAALTLLIKAAKDYYDNNLSEEAKLKKHIEETTQAANEARESYSNLLSTISDYQEAYDAIKTLEEGTLEFYEAINKANEKAKELIDTYDLMPSDYAIDQNGALSIDKESLKNKQKTSEKEMYMAQAAQYQAQADLASKEKNDVLKEAQKYLKTASIINLITGNKEETDITRELADWRTKYNKSQAQEDYNLRQAFKANLFAYGNEDTVSAYKSSTTQQQKIYDDYAIKVQKQQKGQSDQSKYKAQNESWYSLGDGKATRTLNTLGPLGIIGGAIDKIRLYSSNNKIQEDYLKSIGYTQDNNNNWYDENGNLLSKDQVKKAREKTTPEEAADRLNATDNQTVLSIEDIIKKIEEYKKEVIDLGENSQDYIGEAMSAALTGNEDYDYSVLTEEELAKVKEKIDDFNNNTENDLKIKVNLDEITYDESRRKLQDLYNYEDEANNQAVASGDDVETLYAYAAAMENAGELTDGFSRAGARAAAQQMKTNKAYGEAVSVYENNKDAFEDYIKATKKGETVSYITAKGFGSVAKSLKDMGINLKSTSYASEEVHGQLKKLFTGTKKEAQEAYEALTMKGWADSFASETQVAEDVVDEFQNKLNSLSVSEDTGIDTFTDGIQNALLSISGTSDELITKFNSMGLAFGDATMTALTNASQQIAQFSTMTAEQVQDAIKAINDAGIVNVTELKGQPHTVTHTVRPAGGKIASMLGEFVGFTYTDTYTDADQYKLSLGSKAQVRRINVGSLGGSGGSKSSGGGGGSSTPAKDNTQINKYESVEERITGITDKLDDLAKEEKKLTGLDYVTNINKQMDETKNKIKAIKDGMAIASGEMIEYQNKLSKYGFKFDENGAITNYYEVYKKQQNKFNNSSRKGKDKDVYDEFKKVTEYYINTTLKNYEKYGDDLVDEMEKIAEAAIKKLKKTVSDALNLKEVYQSWNEFKNAYIDGLDKDSGIYQMKVALDNFQDNIDNLTFASVEQKVQNLLDLGNAAFVNGLKTGDFQYEGNEQGWIDDSTEALKEFMTEFVDLDEQIKSIGEGYAKTIEEITEEVSRQLDLYDKISSQMEHDKNLITLIYGEKSYDKLAKYFEKEIDNYNNKLELDAEMVAFYSEKMEEAREMFGEDSEAYKVARSNFLEFMDRRNSDLEAGIEKAKDKLINANAEIAKAIEDIIAGSLGFEYAEQEWEMLNKESEQYLDNINAAYGIQELQNKINDSMNDLNSPAAQQKLNNLMKDELKFLKEKDKLSQYDLDRANLKYEIALKQIALEEAQANKSKLRLRRDSQGNYTYQYAADEDEINKIQNELSALQNNLYNLDKGKYHQNLQDIENLTAESLQKIQEIYDDATLTEEEREQKRLDIQTYYGDLINDLVADNEYIKQNYYESTIDSLEDFYKEEPERLQEMVNQDKDILMNDLDPAWTSLYQDVVNNLTDIEDAYQGYLQQAIDEMGPALETFNQEVETMANKAKVDFENIQNGIDPDLEKLENLSKSTEGLTNEFTSALEPIEEWKDAIGRAKETLDGMKETLSGTAGELERLIEDLGKNNIIEEFADGSNEGLNEYLEGINGEPKVEPVEPKVEEPEPPKVSKANPRLGDYIELKSGHYWYGNSYGGGGSGKVHANKKLKITHYNPGAPYPYNAEGLGWFKLEDIVGYKTGGYTGEWGNDGKLAILHQKELVLNQDDTVNLLSAVSMLRAMLDQTNSIGANTFTSLNNSGQNATENIVINASFPNAINHNEIEEAFRNLTNMATMRVHK